MRRGAVAVWGLGVLAIAAVVPPPAPAATPKEIEDAIRRGVAWIKDRYQRKADINSVNTPFSHALGATCLSGLALLEAGTPPDDPAVQSITQLVRTVSYAQTQTYQISLCLMYLDRLGDPADLPRIQILAVRLLAGQNPQTGGWGYSCINQVTQQEVEFLKSIRMDDKKDQLHPDIERYAQSLLVARQNQPVMGDDNSNTQFAVLALWLARKHGVPVDGALDLVERRFLATQTRTGGWPYNGPAAGSTNVVLPEGSPSMTCAGLLGLATGIARRQEMRAKAAEPKKEPTPPKKDAPDDPFFHPRLPDASQSAAAKPKPQQAGKLDARDRAAQFAFAALGIALRNYLVPDGRGNWAVGMPKTGGGHGRGDFYFLWSLERVGIIYGIDKIGDIDWFDVGANTLVLTQSANGSWEGGGYQAEVNTAFAILFLCRSNLARDLSGKVQSSIATEMRAGPGGAAELPNPKGPSGGGAGGGAPSLMTSQAATLAAQLVRTPESEWRNLLVKMQSGSGAVYTQAMVIAAGRLEGRRLMELRQALAERLARMTAETLRSMARSDEPELRRAALLAMAMKDDRQHIPDLIAALLDEEEMVVRAAKAGLKALTGQDLGPPPLASPADKKLAAEAWLQWWEEHKNQ